MTKKKALMSQVLADIKPYITKKFMAVLYIKEQGIQAICQIILPRYKNVQLVQRLTNNKPDFRIQVKGLFGTEEKMFEVVGGDKKSSATKKKSDLSWIDRLEEIDAVLRHNDNNKWYGVVLEVSADKLGLPEAGIIDVLNVKSDPLLIGFLCRQGGFFPAYHMNKEKWISIQLCKPELDNAIKDLLSLSHELTAPKKCFRRSPINNSGDSASGKEKETDEG